MKMIEQACSALDMEDKVSLVKTESTLFVDFKVKLKYKYIIMPNLNNSALLQKHK